MRQTEKIITIEEKMVCAQPFIDGSGQKLTSVGHKVKQLPDTKKTKQPV